MSKGHGAIQRQVLDILFAHSLRPVTEHESDSYLSMFEMADAITDGEKYAGVDWNWDSFRAVVESVRRAVKKLEAEGEVETTINPVRVPWSRNEYGTTKRMLAARLPLADERAEFYADCARQRAAELNRLLGDR